MISDIHHIDKEHEIATSEANNPQFFSDYQWAIKLKSQLKKVFIWDLFDKKEAKRRLDSRLHKNDYPVMRLSHRIWVRAAVILIAIISGAMIHAVLSGSFRETQFTEIEVPKGQMTQIKLSDGTKIWLNSGSSFKYPTVFDHSSREVFIDGEAYMEVAKNKHKPFVVNAPNFSVAVLGTSFNVSAYSEDDHASVTLVEGSVLLRSNDKKWKTNMVPGQSASFSYGEKMPELTKVNTDFYTSWKDGKIVFRKETLNEIAKKMERWYNVEIEFKDEELKNLVFSGTFLKLKPVEQVFKSLSIMNDQVDFIVENRIDQKNIIHIIKKNN